MPNPDRHGVFDLIELIIRTYIQRGVPGHSAEISRVPSLMRHNFQPYALSKTKKIIQGRNGRMNTKRFCLINLKMSHLLMRQSERAGLPFNPWKIHKIEV